jgi:hypothetical protein
VHSRRSPAKDASCDPATAVVPSSVALMTRP